MSIPRVLVIAGSDSSGGAGLEADQRTLAAHGVYAATATTALTAQNTLGVDGVHITPPAFVGKQINKVMEDGFVEGNPGVVKIGMLASADTIEIVSQTLRHWQEKTEKELKVVLDPVMVATSGAQLLPGDAVRKLRSRLLPITTILTPNIPEANLLLLDADIQYRSPSNLDDLKALAKTLHSIGPKHILLKGGHMPLDRSYQKAQGEKEKAITVDILYPSRPDLDLNSESTDDDGFLIIESPYLSIPNTHGTGCSLASALAANLAHSSISSPSDATDSQSLEQSVRSAVSYVSHGIRNSPTLQLSLHNRGSGPINHFHSLLISPFPTGSFIDYLINHPSIIPTWQQYTHHPFPQAMAAGRMPSETFKKYLVQDYLYLTHFARTYALAAYKSQSISQISTSTAIIQGIETEMKMHLYYCETDFGLSKDAIENTPESTACVAYSRYVLDIGMSADLLALYIALAPCLIGYNLVAERLAATPEYADRKQTNQYWKWIENYTSAEYRESVSKGRELIENEIRRQGGIGKGRAEDLAKVFRTATELEVEFWNIDGYGESK